MHSRHTEYPLKIYSDRQRVILALHYLAFQWNSADFVVRKECLTVRAAVMDTGHWAVCSVSAAACRGKLHLHTAFTPTSIAYALIYIILGLVNLCIQQAVYL